MRRLAVPLLLLALAGCRSLPAPGPVAPDGEVRAALVRLQDWHAVGRVAVRAGNDGFSAGFDWREAGGRGELGVRGPFGAGAARVIRTDAHIRIEAGSAAPVEIDAPFDALESAFTDRIGFALPIDSLRFWLLGVPEPGLPSTGAGDHFEQGGWDITISTYTAVPGLPGVLPTRLVLTRASTRIRVLVDRWEALAP